MEAHIEDQVVFWVGQKQSTMPPSARGTEIVICAVRVIRLCLFSILQPLFWIVIRLVYLRVVMPICAHIQP